MGHNCGRFVVGLSTMPPKTAAKGAKGKAGPSKSAKPMKPKEGGGKAKKKWSKGKVRDKLNNLVLFDKATYDKFLKEVPQYELITPSVVSERLKIRASLARHALQQMHRDGAIKMVAHHNSQQIYTRMTKVE